MYSTMFFTMIAFNAFHYGTEASRDEVEVLKKLLDPRTYNMDILPAHGQAALEVKIGIALVSLNEINGNEGYLKATIWFRLTWTDLRFKLDGEDTNENITVLRVSDTKVWKPSIQLTNSFDKQPNLGGDKVLIYPETGNVIWVAHASTQISCFVDGYFFPFDEQTCTFKVTDFIHTADELKLSFYKDKEHVDMSHYWKSGTWAFVSSRAYKQTLKPLDSKLEPGIDELSFEVTFRRIAETYLVTLILPGVFLSFIAVLTFALPTDSNEKLVLSIISIISIVLILMEIRSLLPPSPARMPLLTKYFLFVLILDTFVLLGTTFVLHLVTRDTDMSKWVKTWILNRLGKIMLVKPAEVSDPAEKIPRGENHIQETQPESVTEAEATIFNVLHKKKIQNDKNEAWRKVATILDRAFLLIFILAAIVGIGLYLGMAGITSVVDEAKTIEAHKR